MRLAVDSLCVTRDHSQVLSNVSFLSEKAELIGLIGPNGAGKSTLMRSLSGLQPFTGLVELDGENITQFTPRQLARRLAFLPQDRTVHWPMLSKEIVMLGRMPHQSGMAGTSDCDQQVVADAMAVMDVAELSERPFDRLSGGEQARVLIARVLAQQPQLIIADEPVNGLDPAHQISLMKSFRDLVSLGKTVIASMHDLPLASHWCDRIIVLSGGEQIADGAVKDVLTAQQISEVYGVKTETLSVSGRSIVIPTDLAKKTL